MDVFNPDPEPQVSQDSDLNLEEQDFDIEPEVVDDLWRDIGGES